MSERKSITYPILNAKVEMTYYKDMFDIDMSDEDFEIAAKELHEERYSN